MARLPRYYIKNQPQHIIQRSIPSKNIFISDDDYSSYHQWLQIASDRHQLKVHAYILMPNQVHLLVSPGRLNSISSALQLLGRNYVQRYNDVYQDSGALWQGRYRATILDSKEYLLTCSRYIEAICMQHGFKHPGDYFWSSYDHNAKGEEDPLISEHRIYQALGKTQKERSKRYRDLSKKPLSAAENTLIHESIMKGWALGGDKFLKKIESISNRRAVPLRRGR